MISRIFTGALSGIDGIIIEAEIDISLGMIQFEIVGLPDSSVKEAKERVRTAIKNCGYSFPQNKITVNLAPAYLRKEGSSFDLPIACGILTCMHVLPAEAEEAFVAGELALSGKIRPVNGILPMVIAARDAGIKTVIVASENAEEAALVKGVEIAAVSSLTEIVEYFKGLRKPYAPSGGGNDEARDTPNIDFSDVKGQENIKRALEVAASGKHNILMVGPPGSGKTMMAKRLATILPELSFEESLEVTKIYSVAGQLGGGRSLITQLPFRAPHHTISYAALTGGGKMPKPGEISLAHKGVLFLDEFAEFQKNVLEVLRQPLEEKTINIGRIMANVTYPADFLLAASMNPCPCGYYGEKGKCRCAVRDVQKYLGKLSGPLLDRIDIQVEAKAVTYDDLDTEEKSESSAEIRKRVIKALEIQSQRYKNEQINHNSELTSPLIEKYCRMDEASQNLLRHAFDALGMSARGYHKVVMVARTIADLDNSEIIAMQHTAEAIQFRNFDRKRSGIGF